MNIAAVYHHSNTYEGYATRTDCGAGGRGAGALIRGDGASGCDFLEYNSLQYHKHTIGTGCSCM